MEQKEDTKKKTNTTKMIYIGYTPRLVICTILIPILSILTIIFIYHAFTIDELVNIRYTEQSITNYNIKDNNMDLDIAYQYKSNKENNMQFTYHVEGTLTIIEKDNPEKTYYTEKYQLKEETEENIVNQKKSNYRTNLEINLEDYESIVKKYKESYEVETKSYLDIDLIINYHSTSNASYFLTDENKATIHIPLVEDSPIEVNDINEEKRVDKKPTVRLQSSGLLGLGVLFGLGAILSLSQAILLVYSTMDQKSIYDKTVEKILNKYKRRIEEVPKVPRKTGKIVQNLSSIKEISKVSKNYKVPIKYCVINEHNKCQFFVEYDKELYIYVLKAIDLEKKD